MWKIILIIIALLLLISLFYENKVLAIILVVAVLVAILVGVVYGAVKEREKEEQKQRAMSQALRAKKLKEQRLREQQEQERKKLDGTNFTTKELIKLIIESDKNVIIDFFLAKFLLCDKLKCHNKKFIFGKFAFLFNGFYIKLCKIENLNIETDYINLLSYANKYYTAEICTTWINIDFRKKVIIDEENRTILEKHIVEIVNDIYLYKNMDTFFTLQEFDSKNFFRNDTISKIIKIWSKDIQFYTEIKNNQVNYLDEEKIFNYYNNLEISFNEFQDEKQRKIEEKQQEQARRLQLLKEQHLREQQDRARKKLEYIDYLRNQLLYLYKEKYTAINSLLFSRLIQLNKEYKAKETQKIVQVCKKHIFRIKCKSKPELDRLNFEKQAIEEIKKNTAFFYTFSDAVQEAKNNYDWYMKKYKYLMRVYSIKENVYNFEIDFSSFKSIENRLFKENKIISPIYPTLEISFHYETPSFKHHYEKVYDFDYKELLDLIEKSKQPSKNETKNQRISNLQNKIKSLEEQVKQLQQGQIYSKEKEELRTGAQESNSIYQQLTYYKTLFENGDISTEEYEKKRKELMG